MSIENQRSQPQPKLNTKPSEALSKSFVDKRKELKAELDISQRELEIAAVVKNDEEEITRTFLSKVSQGKMLKALDELVRAKKDAAKKATNPQELSMLLDETKKSLEGYKSQPEIPEIYGPLGKLVENKEIYLKLVNLKKYGLNEQGKGYFETIKEELAKAGITEQDVKAIQRILEVEADGKVGPKTIKATWEMLTGEKLDLENVANQKGRYEKRADALVDQIIEKQAQALTRVPTQVQVQTKVAESSPQPSPENVLLKEAITTERLITEEENEALTEIFEKELKALEEKTRKGSLSVLIDGTNQKMYLVKKTSGKGMVFEKEYKVSTGKGGFGEDFKSYKTPRGLFVVGSRPKARFGEKIRGKAALGQVVPTLQERVSKAEMTTICLYLLGQEESNKNTGSRGVAIHGTNKEWTLGAPDSAGCIRIANKDILSIYDNTQNQRTYVYITDKPTAPLAQAVEERRANKTKRT